MNSYSKYSNEQYIHKKQLLNQYPQSVAECIWVEIQKDRKLYRYPLSFHEKEYFITMNTYVFKRMLKIYEWNQLESKQIKPIHEELAIYLQRNHLSMSHSLFSFLIGEELLLLKLFVVWYTKMDDSISAFLLQYYGNEDWYPCIKKIERIQDEETMENDLTYVYRHFLDSLYLQLCDKMISLINSGVCVSQKYEELCMQYPELSEKAISFYVEHRQLNCYYTLEHYIKFTHTSYESARQTMEKLVKLDWYKKHKIGKKFVYSIR